MSHSSDLLGAFHLNEQKLCPQRVFLWDGIQFELLAQKPTAYFSFSFFLNWKTSWYRLVFIIRDYVTFIVIGWPLGDALVTIPLNTPTFFCPPFVVLLLFVQIVSFILKQFPFVFRLSSQQLIVLMKYTWHALYIGPHQAFCVCMLMCLKYQILVCTPLYTTGREHYISLSLLHTLPPSLLLMLKHSAARLSTGHCSSSGGKKGKEEQWLVRREAERKRTQWKNTCYYKLSCFQSL